MEIEAAIEFAIRLGADYVDIRWEQTQSETLLVKNGKVESAIYEEHGGAGIRVLLNTWGFASISSFERQKVEDAIRRAIAMAKASRRSTKPRLAQSRVAEDKVKLTPEIDPFDIPMEEKIEICLEADHRAKVNEDVKRTSASIFNGRARKLFVSSEGARIDQELPLTYCHVLALAKSGGVVEYMDDMAGGSGGFEIVRDFDMNARAEDAGKKAVALSKARAVRPRKLPVILDPDFVSLLCHEIIGHPCEADRVLGKEMAWAGGAWWSEKVGRRIGSRLLNASDDPRVKGAMGYFEYDDEGVPARKKNLIKAGLLNELMHSRETASEFKVEPNGNMRAESHEYLPLIRMSNTFIEPGDYSLEEIFDLKRGVYLKGAKVPSIDSMRYNFQISAKEAYLVRHGDLEGPFRGASIISNAPDFFMNIDAVGKDFEMRPIINCGKGDPMQTLHVGNGGPHLRSFAYVAGVK